MSRYYARASARASSFAKELDFQYFVYQNEGEYPIWTTKRRFLDWLYSLPDSLVWNSIICLFALVTIVLISMNFKFGVDIIIGMYSFLYIQHVIALLCHDCNRIRNEGYRFPTSHWCGYILDVLSFSYMAVPLLVNLDKLYAYGLNLGCFYIRLHRPFNFLLALNDHSLRGSVIGTLLKCLYIFAVVRVIATNIFIWIGEIPDTAYENPPFWLQSEAGRLFFKGFLDIHKLFILIGPESHPKSDMSRIFYMMVMISGCLLLMGITIASLALILCVYMGPEEMFRARFRVIMNDMGESSVPAVLHEKVETFYRMYWHKQKAVSIAELLPIYPPSLPSVIFTNIYFKAQQKSRILRDLSYQFLSEIAKHMETIHYIPGDAIIRRNSPKSSIIYISYGDIEMLSAEDDETAILRFTRGTIINPCGGCMEVACTRSHVAIRAATFCTAHVLKAADLWRVSTKFGKLNGQSFIIHSSFEYHLDRVKKHYTTRVHPPVKYKSNILLLKRNLMELKEAEGPDGKLLLERTDLFLEIADCYIMRNLSDASLTDEFDAICLRPTFPCILQPSSSLLHAWHIFVAFTTLIVTFLHPYNLVYLKTVTVGFKFFNHMVTLIYILDLIIHLSTGTKIEEGVPITFAQTSSHQMVSNWFILDVLSTVPMFDIISDGRFAGMNKLLKLPKMFRVLKQMEGLSVYHGHALRFMSYFLLIILLCYLVAALQQGYWCFEFGYCVVKNISEPPFWVKQPLDDGPVEGRLKFSLYWSISMITFTSHKTTTIGKGLWLNQLFVMIVLEVCTVLHIMVEATYSATIMVTETMRDQYKTCIDSVKSFLVKNDVDPILRNRFINYLQLCWYTDEAYSITHGKTSILFDLPQHVYQDILAMQRSKYILCVPFMKFLNNAMLKEVSSHTRLFYTSPNEILLNTGDISNEIYVIKQGFCEIVDPSTKKAVSLISSKSHFGDVECLLRFPAYYTVRAVTHVQVFTISRKHLTDAIETPKIKDAILFAKQQPEFSVLQECSKEPFMSYELPKTPPNRQRFPLPRKYEADYNFLHPFNQLGFLSILRYVFPRYTIRPDCKYLRHYELIRAGCAFLAANIYPLYSFLMLQFPNLSYVTFLLGFAAFFDIFQRMLVGYFDDNGILVYHPASTAAHYMKGAFLVDLLACIPLEIFDRTNNYFENNAYRQPGSYQFFMYNRILQLYRLPHALEILNDYIDRQDIILIIKAFPLFMAVVVLVTSLTMEYSVQKWSPIGGGWLLVINRDPVYGNWIEAHSDAVRYNITETPWNLVLTTYYWVIYETTTTGFNLFQPCHISILSTLILGMIFGAMITTYFAVRVISIRSNVNQALAGFQEHMKDIVMFMEREKLDKELQREVLSYYEYKWDKTGGIDYRTVLKLCDQITLRTDAILHIYGRTFTECPILEESNLALLRILGRAVRSIYFRDKMTVIECDDVITDLYFVDYGTMEVQVSNYKDFRVIDLPRGSVFGNLDNTKSAVSHNKIVAQSNVHLLKINTEIFFRVIQEFPEVKEQINLRRPHYENYIVGNMCDQCTDVNTWTENMFTNAIKRQKLFKYLQEHNKVTQRYFIIISLLCVFGDMYNAAFGKNYLPLISALYFLDICFLTKIFFVLVQPYIAEEESSRRVAYVARKKYFCGEFKYDVLSCLPTELMCWFNPNPWRTFPFLRLNRAFRVVTIYNSLKRYQQNLSVNLTFMTISSVAIWFTLFVHTSTCIWHLLGIYEDMLEPKSSWQYHDDGTSLCQNYICSMYFVLTTFSQNGVGDILPKKQTEVIFVCVLMILSTMIYMIYIGEFSNIIQFRYFRCFSFYAKYLELQEFLNNNRVSENLTTITKRYTLHLWQDSRGLQAPEFLITAPQCLRLKVMSAAYMYHLKKHPVFGLCEPAFLRHLVGCLKPFTYNEDMYIVKEGEITNAMYFIHKGRVVEIDEEFEEKTNEFKAGEYFGWENGYKCDVAYNYSYKTAIKSKILSLSFDDWDYLRSHFPISDQSIQQNGNQEFPDNFPKELVRERRVQMLKASVSAFGRKIYKKRKNLALEDDFINSNNPNLMPSSQMIFSPDSTKEDTLLEVLIKHSDTEGDEIKLSTKSDELSASNTDWPTNNKISSVNIKNDEVLALEDTHKDVDSQEKVHSLSQQLSLINPDDPETVIVQVGSQQFTDEQRDLEMKQEDSQFSKFPLDTESKQSMVVTEISSAQTSFDNNIAKSTSNINAPTEDNVSKKISQSLLPTPALYVQSTAESHENPAQSEAIAKNNNEVTHRVLSDTELALNGKSVDAIQSAREINIKKTDSLKTLTNETLANQKPSILATEDKIVLDSSEILEISKLREIFISEEVAGNGKSNKEKKDKHVAIAEGQHETMKSPSNISLLLIKSESIKSFEEYLMEEFQSKHKLEQRDDTEDLSVLNELELDTDNGTYKDSWKSDETMRRSSLPSISQEEPNSERQDVNLKQKSTHHILQTESTSQTKDSNFQLAVSTVTERTSQTKDSDFQLTVSTVTDGTVSRTSQSKDNDFQAAVSTDTDKTSQTKDSVNEPVVSTVTERSSQTKNSEFQPPVATDTEDTSQTKDTDFQPGVSTDPPVATDKEDTSQTKDTDFQPAVSTDPPVTPDTEDTSQTKDTDFQPAVSTDSEDTSKDRKRSNKDQKE